MTTLTKNIAKKFAALALAHVGREYPNKMDHVMAGPKDVAGPRALHPIFYGSFDWHSCVHGYWLLARLMRRYPDFAQAKAITELFDERITVANVEGECAYLRRPESRGFERPYGWGWLLALQAELNAHRDGAGARAAKTLQPLAKMFSDRFKAFLPLADYPIRTGVHSSTAFAFRLAADYAEPADAELFALLRARALGWYSGDEGAQAWEPSQDDFLSATLMEAGCMRRFLSVEEFRAWFARFLPDAANEKPASLFSPAAFQTEAMGRSRISMVSTFRAPGAGARSRRRLMARVRLLGLRALRRSGTSRRACRT